ncbi:S-layer homology domain-containing protein [Paenibacillus sp. SI8]|uniref:S-layer homology domain-containing protein n=1 Tax=unclassified Paenibacillus TaxID=185978 RepID=UPI003466FF66
MSIRKHMKIRLWQGAIARVIITTLFFVMVQSEILSYAAAGQTLDGTIYVNDTVLPANGTSQTTVVLLLKDQDGHDASIPPEKVKFNTTLGHLDENVASSVYGQYSSVLTAPVTAGVALLSAEVDGVVVQDMARVNFKAGAPSPEHSAITASSQSLAANGYSQTVISLYLKDKFGNDVAEQADSIQLFTTLGKMSSVTYETYSHYEANIVSAVYGNLGSWVGSPGPLDQLKYGFDQGAIPAGTPNSSPLPTTLSLIYKSYGYYKAILTAPSTGGVAQITANLNGRSVTSSVYVSFTEDDPSSGLTGLRFGQPSYPVIVGQQISTRVDAVGSNSYESNVTPYAAYKLTDPSIAEVDSGGNVRAWKKGQTVLTATYGGLTADTTILVTENSQGNTDVPSRPNVPATSPAPSALDIEMIPEGGQKGRKVITPEDIRMGKIEIKMASVGGQIHITAANIQEIRAINPQAALVIQIGSAAMSLPISELDEKAYSQKYGIPKDSILFTVVIREPDKPVQQAIQHSVEAMQAQLLAAPMEFEVQVTGNNNQSAFISSFNRYVSRTLSVKGDSISDTATGVWWVPGADELRYVPTYFERKDDQWLAVMKRQGASIYAVIDRPVSFLDVEGHWSSKDVKLLASKLIVQGRSKEIFVPDASITRAEIAALLVRALGMTESKEQSPFSDVSGGWYVSAVNTAYHGGIISGYDDGTFRPMQKITREELAGMIVKAMKYTTVKPDVSPLAYQAFSDQSTVSRWALDDVKYAVQWGIIEGDGMFRPASYTTRAEAVTMLKRMLKLIQFIQ